MKLTEHIRILTALKEELGEFDPEVAFTSVAGNGQAVHDLADIAVTGAFNIETKKLETLVELKLKTA